MRRGKADRLGDGRRGRYHAQLTFHRQASWALRRADAHAFAHILSRPAAELWRAAQPPRTWFRRAVAVFSIPATGECVIERAWPQGPESVYCHSFASTTGSSTRKVPLEVACATLVSSAQLASCSAPGKLQIDDRLLVCRGITCGWSALPTSAYTVAPDGSVVIPLPGNGIYAAVVL